MSVRTSLLTSSINSLWSNSTQIIPTVHCTEILLTIGPQKVFPWFCHIDVRRKMKLLKCLSLVKRSRCLFNGFTKGPLLCLASMHHDSNDQYCSDQNNCQHREAGNGCQSPDIRSFLGKCASVTRRGLWILLAWWAGYALVYVRTPELWTTALVLLPVHAV